MNDKNFCMLTEDELIEIGRKQDQEEYDRLRDKLVLDIYLESPAEWE